MDTPANLPQTEAAWLTEVKSIVKATYYWIKGIVARLARMVHTVLDHSNFIISGPGQLIAGGSALMFTGVTLMAIIDGRTSTMIIAGGLGVLTAISAFANNHLQAKLEINRQNTESNRTAAQTQQEMIQKAIADAAAKKAQSE